MKLLILTLFTLSVVNATDPEVTIPLGTIRGRKVFIYDKYVDEYLGVPYAKPPIGDLRFAKPKPITEKWKSPYVAQSLPPACIQKGLTPMSEDCLYLNVFVLENTTEKAKSLKPVLFWIHGGGFEGGSSRPFNASILAKLSDCIVVTINYRLFAFGFLFGNNNEIPGNVGLYDQLLAMKWVNENIVYFNGDKNLVTIFGESAGAWSVSLHLVSPLSYPYYKNAIIMSGVDMDYLALDPKDFALKRAKALSSVVGCNYTGDPPSLPSKVVKCLKEKDSTTLLKAAYDVRVVKAAQTLMFARPFLPIFKDEFLPLSPKEIWKRKQFKKNTSLLIGTVYNEFMAGNNVKPRTKPSDYVRHYCATVAPPEFLTRSECEEMIRIYFAGIDEAKDRQRAIDTVTEISDDFIFHCPSIAFAEVFSEINSVYQYYFNYKSQNDSPACGPKYPCHGSDVPFTFAYVRNKHDIIPTLHWVRIITDFAKTGKVFWPQYYKTTANKLVPVYYEFRGNLLPNNTHIALKNYNCQIWKSFVLSKSN